MKFSAIHIGRCVGCAAVATATPASAAPALLGGDRDACLDARQPAILARIAGLKDRTGRVKIELYPANDRDFLRRDDDLLAEGKAFRRVWADLPASGPVAMCIRAPAAGSYAVVFTHQREGKKKFNFWVDGVGVPNADRLGRAKPTAAQARIGVGRGTTTTDITVQYMRGLSGFGPVRGS